MSAMPHAHGECHGQSVLPAVRVESGRRGEADAAVSAPAAGARDFVRRAADRLDFHRPRRDFRSCRARPRGDCSGDSGGPCGEGKNPDRGVRTRSRTAVVMAPFQDGGTPGDAPGGGIAGPYDEMSRVLATLPRPRPVRMRRRGKIIDMVVSIALLASLGIYAATGVAAQQAAGGQNTGPSQFPVYAVSI